MTIDCVQTESYNEDLADQIAARVAATLLERFPAMPHLDNLTEECVVSSEGEYKMKQRAYVTLPDGRQVWVQGSSISEIVQNAIKRYENKSDPLDSETFSDYVDSIFDVFLRPRWKDTTVVTNKFLLTKHILPFFGDMELGKITTADVQRFFQGKRDFSKSYTKQMLIILHEILSNAVEDGRIEKEPTLSKRITLPTKVTKRDTLQADDFRDVISNLEKLAPEDALLLALLGFTGMRRGEVLGLKWENVKDDVICVRSEVTFRSNQPIYHDYAKTKSGIRDIPIIDELKPYLVNRGEGFVIGGGDMPCTQSKFDRAWQRIGRTINLHGATPHVFRHTFLSMVAASGVDPKTLQVLAGHSDFNFTYSHYVHGIEENITNAGKVFSAHLRLGSGGTGKESEPA